MKRTLLIVLVVLLAGLGVYFGWRYYTDAYLPNKQITDALEAQTQLFARLRPDLDSLPRAPEPTTPDPGEDPAPQAQTPEEGPDPLADLRAANPDTVGWLTIPGTAVDYPIVQAADNDRYLRRGYDGNYNYVGTPFLDCRCSGGFDGFSSVVYAHHIPGKQEMFADIVKYKDSDWMQDHPRGSLLARDGVHEVLFFAYLTVPSDSFAYETRFGDDADREAYLDGLFRQAGYSLGLTAEELKQTGSLRLLLLSTCSYEYEQARGVLVGVIQ